MENIKELIDSGRATLGIEFGSTRIKAILIDEDYKPIASGSHEWESCLVNNIWTYSLDDIWEGLHYCYNKLTIDVKEKYGTDIVKLRSIGFSAMMHGYLAFDKDNKLLVPFRTWRNGITAEASSELTELFQYNIPQRWSIAHLYQAILNDENHVKQIDFLTTLAGYIHWKLTGRKVLGIGDASGMFPVASDTKSYDPEMIRKFEDQIAEKGIVLHLANILPEILIAGEDAGKLTETGAHLLDESGKLQSGCPVCPPEGDAGTGMVATNSVGKRTCNISAGTSIFGMVVLETNLKNKYEEIDMVATPDGSPVAMVHANNCTSDLNAWVEIFKECLESFHVSVDTNSLYETLYRKAMEGDADCGGILSYCYLSGENITGIEKGRPMVIRTPTSNFTLANLMRSHLFTALGALKLGMDILIKKERVEIDRILGHGGLFKTSGVAQSLLASLLGIPVSVMKTSGEGGPWGMALLAAYRIDKTEGESLQEYLNNKVFAGKSGKAAVPDESTAAGIEKFIERYVQGLPIEKTAGQYLD